MGNLSVHDLSVSYLQADGLRLTALERIGFELPAGASLGIVGESGSGKSTLARALMGYTRNGARIDGGSVTLGEQRIVPRAVHQRHRFAQLGMAYVPQNPLSSLTPHLKVGAQVSEAVQLTQGATTQASKAIALELLAAMGLPDPQVLYGRYPHQLSGGQRQRVVIAAAMATRPDVLILDEPTTALDKTTERQVLDLLKDLQARFQTSLVYVSHDLHVIANVCDQILVMRHGQQVEQGSTQQVFSQPQHSYTRLLLEAMPSVQQPASTAVPKPSVCAAPTSPARVPVLELQNVNFHYPIGASWKFWQSAVKTQPAVEHVSLALHQGETLGLVGESGSGKSTIAALVAGLHHSHGGQVRFEGEALPASVGQRSKEQRRRIQIIFQDALSSLNPSHKVGDIVMRPLQLFFGMDHAIARARAVELLQALHLEPELMDRFPRQLSGGQQQRVAIARAFAAQPDLVICDEITSALDTSIQAQVLRNLRELQRSMGTTILFISHDLGVVQQMAQNVMVLHRGQVQAYGPTDAIFRHPPNDYTRLLLEAASSAAGQVPLHPANASAPRFHTDLLAA